MKHLKKIHIGSFSTTVHMRLDDQCPFYIWNKGLPNIRPARVFVFRYFCIIKGTAWYERRIGVMRNKLFFTSSKCIIFFYIFFSIFVLDKAINQIVLISCKLKWMCSAAYRNYSCFAPYLHYMLIWLVSILCFLCIIWGCIIFHIRIIFNLLLIDLTI